MWCSYQCEDLGETPEGEENCEEHLGGWMRRAAQILIEGLLFLLRGW
jgi:hypothetical protein